MFQRIVVAYDGSPNADHALGVAIDVAHRFAAALEIVTVAPQVVPVGPPRIPPPLSAEETRMYRELLGRARLRARDAGVGEVGTTFREGNVVEELLAHLERTRPDLVVVGARGLSRVRRLLLGSVSAALATHARVPVLIDHLPPA